MAASTPVKPHIPSNPTVFNPDSTMMKSWFKQMRDYCFRSSSANATMQNAAFTLGENYLYAIDCTAAPFTITLPPSQRAGQGREYCCYVRIQGASPVTFAVTAGSGDSIVAATTSIQYLNDSASWYTDGQGIWYLRSAIGAGAGGAPANPSYLTLGLDATLTAERVLTPGTRLIGTDTGANGTYTLAVRSPVVTKNVDYVVTGSEYVIFVDATGANRAITLCAANVYGAGYSPSLRIKRIDSSANTVTISRAGADTIDGGTSVALGALQSVDLESDGVSLWGVM